MQNRYLRMRTRPTIKIDRSFVNGLPNDKNNKAIVNAIIAFSHGLGINVIAEGIETEAELNFLIDAGCEMMQGYYFSKPLPSGEIDELLKSGKKLKLTNLNS